MDWDRLITIEQMEEATNELLETGKKVGADSWQQRVKNQTPHCGFGEAGTCCRICSMGPCRITPKAPRGICGCDVHGIVGRNYLRFTAGGAATHSDHGRQICHTLYQAKDGGSYQVKDPEKLLKIAHEWGIETEGKDIYDLAHEVAETGLMEYGKPFGVQRYLKRAPEHTQELWRKAGIEPRAIDREVSQSMHMTHMGCSSLPEALIKQSLRAGLSDGWGGSMAGTEFSDVLFELIPELAPCQGFRQYNPHHTRDVWTHTLAVVDGVPPEEPLRLAALLHDAGKPATFFFDKNLVGHFYGHPAAGAAVTEEVLRRLRYDRATTEFVTQLVAVHGRPIPDDLRGMRRMLARLGAPVCRALIQLRCADAIGTGTADAAEQTARCEAALSLLAQAEKGCSSVSTLAVSGRDLLALGMTQGPAVGAVLKRLLDAVLDGSAPNDRASLLKLASEIGNNA